MQNREEEKNNRYRITQVIVNLIQDKQYNDFNMRILKFAELAEDFNKEPRSPSKTAIKTLASFKAENHQGTCDNF